MPEDRNTMECCQGKILLSGSVAGVDACQLVTADDELVIGSGLDCDLVVHDPLVPRRAFRLSRIKRHTPDDAPCQSHWAVDSLSGARVYVNDDIVSRGRLAYGDRISIGCHQLRFDRATPHEQRSRRTNIQVQDVCARLVGGTDVPDEFLNACPTRENRRRMRTASRWALGLAAAVALLVLVSPRRAVFEAVQPPLEVVVAGEISRAPAPDSVRSLKDIARKTAPSAAEEVRPADLLPAGAPAPDMPDAPAAQSSPAPAAPSPRAVVMRSADALPPAEPVQPVAAQRDRLDVRRAAAALAGSAPRRRLTVAEAESPALRAELARYEARIRTDPAASEQAQKVATAGATPPRPTAPAIKPDASRQLAALAGAQPSPLKYEPHRGAMVPVASLPRALAAIEAGSTTPGVQFDGQVSDSEIAVSWKSGQFRIHGPNPQPASPPTYCYVGTATNGGRDCLYVSFVCEDPDVNAIVTGQPGVWNDDSVEVFFDTNFDRRDYFHLIANTRGRYTAQHCRNGDEGINHRGGPWRVSPQIKTAINPEGKRWTCEILIPFSDLGGRPPKGSRWAVNFTRAFRGQGHARSVYQNWFLVYNGKSVNYHNPELYGVFQW